MHLNGDHTTINSFELLSHLSDEDWAFNVFEKIRWKDGITCPYPYCGHTSIRKEKRKHFYCCRSCHRKFTVRTGTVMDRSHISLGKWLYAIYMILTARKGISSLQLSKELGITQKSCWFMCHRIRKACAGDGKKLCGIVEVDETYVGGKEKNKHASLKELLGRGSSGKIPVFGMRSRNGTTVGVVTPGTSSKDLHGIIKENVRKRATIISDDFKAYNGLENEHYRHKVVNHSAKQYVDGMAYTNGMESVWAVLKRGFYGVYHKFSMKHLQKYIDEFSFRLNQGNVKIPTPDRMKSLIRGMIKGGKFTHEMCVNGTN